MERFDFVEYYSLSLRGLTRTYTLKESSNPRAVFTSSLSLGVKDIYRCYLGFKLFRINEFGVFLPFNPLGKGLSPCLKLI